LTNLSAAGEGEEELDLAAVPGGDRAEARVGDVVVGEGDRDGAAGLDTVATALDGEFDGDRLQQLEG
jgi:hypothetical protein